ncbi:hypothetical protein CYMTET_31552, partial [Cymbomonas tetramitiformis]
MPPSVCLFRASFTQALIQHTDCEDGSNRPCRVSSRRSCKLRKEGIIRVGSLLPHTGIAGSRSRATRVSCAAGTEKIAGVKYDGRLAKVPSENIRNFSIIAHIDHGKSTLADTLLLETGTVEDRAMKEQFLDGMDLERERGITIKLQAARMTYTASNGETYVLNLIDTPGHVDFSYEVSRSLAACEGALLVVDASQGVEAQTLANVYLALENDLEIIPVLNKIDLPGADPDRVITEIEDVIGLDCSEAIMASAKQRIGVTEILEAICEKVPAPAASPIDEPLQALIYDSYYDPYRGVIVYFRVLTGSVKKGDKVKFMNTKFECDVIEVGVLSPAEVPQSVLYAGEVGYLHASIKSVKDARVGDTITQSKNPAQMALSGYKEASPMVFCGLYPTETDQYPALRDSLEKLQLSDAALQFEPEVSGAMGFGFRCGFLGLLHMEIVQERLEREYDLVRTRHSSSLLTLAHAGRRCGGSSTQRMSLLPRALVAVAGAAARSGCLSCHVRWSPLRG